MTKKIVIFQLLSFITLTTISMHATRFSKISVGTITNKTPNKILIEANGFQETVAPNATINIPVRIPHCISTEIPFIPEKAMEMFLIAGDFIMFTNFNNPTEKAGICVNDENERTFFVVGPDEQFNLITQSTKIVQQPLNLILTREKEFLHIQQQE